MYSAYLHHGLVEADLTGPSYLRIDRIKQHLAAGQLDAGLHRTKSAAAEPAPVVAR